jgi:hypothetical protein
MVMTLPLVNTRSAVPGEASVDVVVASAPVVEAPGGGGVVVEVVVPPPSEPEVQEAVTSTRAVATRTCGPPPK